MKTSLAGILKGLSFLIFFGFCAHLNCAARNEPPLTQDSVKVWWSSQLLPGSMLWFTNPPKPSDIKFKLGRQQDIAWEAKGNDKVLSFQINTAISYQSLLGIGTSLEATSIYALLKNKNELQVRTLIRLLIDPVNGMGFNLFRITIGTSDFSDGRACSTHPKGFYTYQDQQEKPFSIQPDIDLGIIKVLQMFLQEAASLKPAQEIKFFASSWSPPAWMKTSGSLIGGSLKTGYEKVLALYFRRFIEAYGEKGIPIYAITLQNEPNFTPDSYPGMRLSPEQERNIALAVYEEFNNSGNGKPVIDTRIWINDHNMNYWTNANKELNDLESAGKTQVIDGVAFHHYNPLASPRNMSKLHDLHPYTDIHLTEHSEWGVAGMYNIQEYFMNWSRSYVYWVPMTTIKLDEHNQGPYNTTSELSPPLFIERGTDSSDMCITPEFYLLSQFSRFIRPGAVRIDCNRGSEKSITSIVFRNKDNTMLQVLVNQTGEAQPFRTVFGDHCFKGILPVGSVGSYIWTVAKPE
jgi:glucosylceramidase